MGKIKFSNKKSNEVFVSNEKWKVLICDDEHEVHIITKTVLRDFIFKHKKIEFLSAYSGEEAINILKEEKGIAVILLDVVMETDFAGLDVVKKIRNELENNEIRIVLRTGQPGYAPEKDVIQDYDINDYKEKTELTDVKLYTTIMSALRSYKDIKTIQRSKKGLEKIIDATRDIYKKNSLELFSNGVLTQIVSILKLNGHSFLVTQDGFSIEKDNDNITLLASTGKFSDKPLDEILTSNVKELLNKAVENKESLFLDDIYVGFIETDSNKSNLIYMTGCDTLNKLDKNLINIFSANVSTAFNNLYLNKEIIDTQKELIETLGETVEKRSKEASHHVRRVAQISYELAHKIGFEEEADMIRSASPMHDVGKIGIPDAILLKPGKLTVEEFSHMKTHTDIGRDILAHSDRKVLKTASIIAYEHHEKWDGTGYPNGKKGEDIHIYGRITAIADVFDALLHKRCYKEPWPIDKVIELFKEQRGKHFDPQLVDIFLDNIEIFKKIEKIN
jgi:response regulator RpfG family c-di-GMP phosphodiesterase